MINLFGPICSTGYSVHFQNLIKSLIENGQEVNITPIGEVQIDSFYDMYIKEGFKNINKFSVKNPSLFVYHDHLSQSACGSPLLTFSVFETSQLKDQSRYILENGPTDVILTTTEEHKQILEQYNFTKPIEVINEGIDDTLFNTIPVDKYIDTKKFTYITSGKREERKNTDITIRTFINLMKEREVALICHTFNPFINNVQDHPFKNLNCWTGVNPTVHGFEYKGFNGKCHTFSYKSCDLYFTTPTIPACNIPSLIHSANVGIQISRAEGWGLPSSEFLGCGLPTITSACTGHNEYVPGSPFIQTNLIVQSDGLSIANDGFWFKSDQGTWLDINIDSYVSKLEETFNDQTKYTNKSEDLANYMSNNFSWNKSTQKLITVIEKYRG